MHLKSAINLYGGIHDTLCVYYPQVGLRTFFGRPGQWFEENDLDGDKNSIFHDVDGSVTGYTDTYVGRLDNYLIRHPTCVNMSQWNGVICSGRYSQVQWMFYILVVLFCPSNVKFLFIILHSSSSS